MPFLKVDLSLPQPPKYVVCKWTESSRRYVGRSCRRHFNNLNGGVLTLASASKPNKPQSVQNISLSVLTVFIPSTYPMGRSRSLLRVGPVRGTKRATRGFLSHRPHVTPAALGSLNVSLYCQTGQTVLPWLHLQATKASVIVVTKIF